MQESVSQEPGREKSLCVVQTRMFKQYDEENYVLWCKRKAGKRILISFNISLVQRVVVCSINIVGEGT